MPQTCKELKKPSDRLKNPWSSGITKGQSTKATITIQSIGFENYSVTLDKLPSKVAKLDILQAKLAWIKLNDIDEDSIELPFHRITPCKD